MTTILTLLSPGRLPGRVVPLLLAATLTALLVASPALAAGSAADTGDGAALVVAAEERERRPIATTPRDQFGLVLYGAMGLMVVLGITTLRRPLRGEREQTDGEFRWR